MADEKKKNEKKHWFKDLRTELKKVTWLTPKQLAKNTAAVIVLVLIVAVIVFVLDRIFLFVDEQGIKKLKDFVQNEEVVQVEDEQEDSESNEIENIVDDAIEDVINEEDSNSKEQITEEPVNESETTIKTDEENVSE